MSGKLTIAALAVVLAGCSDPTAWNRAASEHACTVQQMEKAQAETMFCKKDGGYTAQYCYQTAIQRNCTPLAARTHKETQA